MNGSIKNIAIEKFRILAIQSDGCWGWRKKLSGHGYTYIGIMRNGIRFRAYGHRISYEISKGPIPIGFEIDHLCRNRGCTNPDHLEAVTRKENQRRGMGPGGINYRKNSCVNGHAFTPESTYLRPDGRGKNCRLCSVERDHRGYVRRYRRCASCLRSHCRCGKTIAVKS